MLEQGFKFALDEEKEYNLRLRRDANWERASKRLLIVLQMVPQVSLKERDIAPPGLIRDTITNCIKYSRKICRNYGHNPAEFAYAIANFNSFKHLQLKGNARKDAENHFAARLNKLIKKLKPTHILISGDIAAQYMLPEVTHHAYKRGWIHSLNGIPTVTTVDLDRLLEKNGAKANLLGFWTKHLAYLMMGKHPHNIGKLAATPRYIDTMAKFEALMARLEKLGPTDNVACDTETANLTVHHNAIYTIQFATNKQPDIGYVLPIDHPMTPYTGDEIKVIKKRLRAYFNRPANQGPELVTFNGMYDLRVIRQALKLPIINLKVWEIMAGEHLLDENTTELTDVGPPVGGLAATFSSYGNDFYYRAKFSKEDRTTTGTVPPSDAEFLKYASTDVVALIGIKEQQLRRADYTPHLGGPYTPYYERHMRHIMSDQAHALSHLREDGSYVDRAYLRFLMTKESPLRKEIQAAERQLRAFPNAQKANANILAESGMKAKSLWGAATTTEWAFKLSKGVHKAHLFLDVMGLEPVDFTDTGAPSVGKAFIAQYKGQHREVAVFEEWSKRTKLLSTYVRGWYKKLRKNQDSAKDGYLRPDYLFWNVVTGRLASKNPSLQQVPARGKLSKIIKRMFITPPGHLMIRFDYSAHEVRMWSVASGDKILAAAFGAGQSLRQQWIQNPTQEILTELKTKGDIHIQNVYRFWKVWVSKDDPRRDAVKRVIFGLLYGLSSKSMGFEVGPRALARKRIHEIDDILFLIGDTTKKEDLVKVALDILGKSATDADRKATDPKEVRALVDRVVAGLKAERKQHNAGLGSEEEDERKDTKYAQDLIDKTFESFPMGAKWTNRMKKMAEDDYYVYSPVHRRRHLYASLTKDKSIVSRQVRRGSNAPIQGFSSELGSKAGYMILQAYYKELPKFIKKFQPEFRQWDSKVQFSRQVHDASYFAVPYFMVLPHIHICQWQATYGLARATEEQLGLKFTIEPEIEIEIGACDASTIKWDWSLPHLIDSISKSVDDGIQLGAIKETKAEVMDQILAPYRSVKTIEYLQKHYPLLNVPDLTKQITEAVKKYDQEEKARQEQVSSV